MSASPAQMIGTALTGHGWQTYYVTPEGDLLVHVGVCATAHDGPPQLLGRYESFDLARAVAYDRLRRDLRMATEDQRVAFADIGALLDAECRDPRADWASPVVSESPVSERTARHAMPGLITG